MEDDVYRMAAEWSLEGHAPWVIYYHPVSFNDTKVMPLGYTTRDFINVVFILTSCVILQFHVRRLQIKRITNLIKSISISIAI